MLHAGINDISEGHGKDDIVDGFKNLTAHIQRQLPHTKIIISSILPMRNLKVANQAINEINNSLEMFCKENGYQFVNNTSSFVDSKMLYHNEVHLNPKGAAKLGTNIKKAVYDSLPNAIDKVEPDHFRHGQPRRLYQSPRKAPSWRHPWHQHPMWSHYIW